MELKIRTKCVKIHFKAVPKNIRAKTADTVSHVKESGVVDSEL